LHRLKGRSLLSAFLLLASLASLSVSSAYAEVADPSKLESLQKEIDQTLERRKELEKEAKAARADAEKVQKDLIATAARVQAREGDVSRSEERLEGLEAAEAVLRARLLEKRGTLAKLLSALARLDRNPPPALAVKPDDALGAIRSALLLASSVPELRAEADLMRARLDDLARLRERITAEHETLGLAKLSLDREKAALEILLAEKRKQEQFLVSQADSEQAKAQRLSAEARDLTDLIARLEAQAAARMPQLRPDPKPDPKPTAPGETVTAVLPRPSGEPPRDTEPPPTRHAALPDPGLSSLGTNRLFSQARGLIPLPATGTIQHGFGTSDGQGGTQQGINIVTRHNAAVIAPFDGKVMFAGPFRRYGQLLIIAVGEGYHVLLAGMTRIDANVGQNILAGEPVGNMGASSADPKQGGNPLLYMELRKDGAAVDPRPWLVMSDRKARS